MPLGEDYMDLLSRDEFRERVFARDLHQCVICHLPAVDAHHIIERRLWPDGGYHLNNGASLCEVHHKEAEMTRLTCEEIRQAVGITTVALPPYFDRSERYDKWGNVFLDNGLRVRGELFFDASVQKVLEEGGVLDQFTPYVKFPKIAHLPWSEGIDKKTDRVLDLEDVRTIFEGQVVVVTEKMDGENTSFYSDYLHARSLSSRPHPSRNWIKNLHSRIAHNIPEGWRVCGENLYAEHSIHYRHLPSYFLVFAIYDDRNVCLGWDETVEYAALLELPTVPLLCGGVYEEERIRACFTGRSTFRDSVQEGYVLRLAGAIPWSQHRRSFGKFVRGGHVQTTHGWMYSRITPNELEGKQ